MSLVQRRDGCLVDSGHYLLACSRYIKLNPVGARMVAQPGDNPWSSHASNAGGCTDPPLTPHPEFLALGVDPTMRAAAYRALFTEALPGELVDEIRNYLRQQKALGSDRFRSGGEGWTAGSLGCDRLDDRQGVEIVPDTISTPDTISIVTGHQQVWRSPLHIHRRSNH